MVHYPHTLPDGVFVAQSSISALTEIEGFKSSKSSVFEGVGPFRLSIGVLT